MKQKYTLNIADIELNVITDAEPETVAKVSGQLDRKMREIFLQSRSITRNEAAMLCAMEFCFDRMSNQIQLTELESLNAKYDEVLRVLKAKNDELTADIERLESENTLLRSLITTKKKEEEEAAEASAAPAKSVSPAEFLNQVAQAQTEAAPAKTTRKRRTKTAAPTVSLSVGETVPAAEKNAPAAADADEDDEKSRSKVGTMFDLLDFDEI